MKYQTHYKLTPLDYFVNKKPFTATRRDVWQPPDPKQDYLAPWKTTVRAMKENAPAEKDNILLKWFSDIGISPDTDFDSLNEDIRVELIRAEKAGMEILRGAAFHGYGSTKKNNWNSPSKYLGRAGKNNEFLLRGAVQCLGGIVSNDVEESVYLNTAIDAEGNRLSGRNQYILHFPSGQLPKVKAFWSLTMYGMDFCLVDNPANKYSVGDRTPGLTKNADGRLTIYIQQDSPGMDKEANWLPTNDREFYVVLRCYLPDEEIYEHRWFPQAIELKN